LYYSDNFHINSNFSGFIVFYVRRFLNDPTSFSHFCDYLPFEEGMTLYLNKHRFSRIIVPGLIGFDPVVLEKKIFKNFQCTFTLSSFSPLREI
jgi:hypothetical protein